MIVACRLSKKSRSGEAFTGEGARRFGGRWNHKGTPVIYVSESLSLAALEQFVHLGREGFKIPFVYFRVVIPKNVSIQDIKKEALPKDWRAEPSTHSTKDIGTSWIKNNTSAVLRVPSIIVPGENNFLLNINHKDFKKIKVGDPEPFRFDHRMEK